MDRDDLITRAPKAELHYHIDSISPELALRFAVRNQAEVPFHTIEEARSFYRYSDLDGFITALLTAISTIQKNRDFMEMVTECAADCIRQNIIYRELMFDYTACYGSRGIPLEEVIGGFAEGLALVRETYGNAVDLRFIANLDRTADVEDNCRYLDQLSAYLDRLPFVAVGLDMTESGFPAGRQEKAFRLAESMGLSLTAHTGETEGPDAIRETMETLRVNRIDHGIRAAEDEALMEELAREKILLTVCPDSNICLGAYPDWESYPLRTLLERGVKVCVNSDDPPCFREDLNGNLRRLADTVPLDGGGVRELIENAFRYNFAGSEHLGTVCGWFDSCDR